MGCAKPRLQLYPGHIVSLNLYLHTYTSCHPVSRVFVFNLISIHPAIFTFFFWLSTFLPVSTPSVLKKNCDADYLEPAGNYIISDPHTATISSATRGMYLRANCGETALPTTSTLRRLFFFQQRTAGTSSEKSLVGSGLVKSIDPLTTPEPRYPLSG